MTQRHEQDREELRGAVSPEGTLSKTTGVRKDHCLLIMLGGRGPGLVALFSIIAFDRRRNSYSRHQCELEPYIISHTEIST